MDRHQFDGLCKCIWHRSLNGNNSSYAAESIVYQILVSKQNDNDYFIEAVNKNSNLFGFARLRIIKSKGISILREIRVFGHTASLSENCITGKTIQHLGIGKKILKKAEYVTRELGLNRIYVNSGVGAYGYFEKLGYAENNYYLSKNVTFQ